MMRRSKRPVTPDTGVPHWTPSNEPQQRQEIVLWGAHGGAGTTTLATWLYPAWDMGAMPPEPIPRYPAAIAEGRPLLVVCRSTIGAAHLATTAFTAVNSQGGQVAALVVVSDGWPEPLAATVRFRLLAAQSGALIRIPFVPGLRLSHNPAAVSLPRNARRALDQIQALAGPCATAR
jgi:hypothetical protein